MAAALALPCGVYCYLAAAQPTSFTLIASLIGVEQFGYGFGFTAFMLYLMYFSRGESQTSHYAFSTAFMALGMMLPGMAAGWIFDTFVGISAELTAGASIITIAGILVNSVLLWLGIGNPYEAFFWLVMLTTISTFLSTAAIRRHCK